MGTATQDPASVAPRALREAMEAGEPLQVVDVRSAGEYAAGHIPGAVNIPLEEVESRLADLATHARVVVACQSGTRAAMACEMLAPKRPDLVQLEKGTDAWLAAGLPVVRTTATRWAVERQLRLVAGAIALTGGLLAVLVAPAWGLLAAFVGFGLVMASVTGFCPMALLLAAMPWNRAR